MLKIHSPFGHVCLLEIYNSTCEFISISLEPTTEELPLYPSSPVLSLT